MSTTINNAEMIRIMPEANATGRMPQFENGEKIEAEVVSVKDDVVTLQTKDNFKFTMNMKNMPETKLEPADKLSFEVVKTQGNRINLKLLPKEAEKTPEESERDTKIAEKLQVLSIKVTEENLAAAKTLLDHDIEIKKETMKALAQINKEVSYVVNNVTAEVLVDLSELGLSKDKLSIQVLNSAMKEIEVSVFKKEFSDKEIKDIVKKHIQAEKVSPKELEQKAEIVKELLTAGIAPTEKNVKAVEAVDKQYEAIQEIDEKAILSAVESGEEITVERVYRAKFSGKGRPPAKEMSEQVWQKLEPEVKKSFERQDIALTQENVEAAKQLIQNEIPVTKENVENYVKLQKIEKHSDIEKVHKKVFENIKQDKPVADVPLFDSEPTPVPSAPIQENYEAIMAELPEMTEEVIKVTVSNHDYDREPVTLDNFRNTIKIRDQKPREYTRQRDEVVKIEQKADSKTEDLELKTVQAKRQLAEIQLKLTQEAATRLAGKGIEINTQPLEQAIESLKQVESDMYSQSLRMMNTEPTPENIEKMAAIYDQVKVMMPTTYQAYSEIIREDADFTIDTVANANKHAISRMLDDFETFATAPSPKYGDSFRQVLNAQIPELLNDLGIEPTEQNVKAAKILSKTQIDVTTENITEVKIIDRKIETIADKLHPTIAANMVKEGLNPTDMHVDEVIDYIDKFDDVYGDNLSDKIAKFIMEMDQNKELEPETRESMIAMYRLLHTVKKDESVAIGIALKSEADLTLGNLMEASNYYKRTAGRREDINVNIDDNFGALEKLVTPKNNIRQTLAHTETAATREVEPITIEPTPATTEPTPSVAEEPVEIEEPKAEPRVAQTQTETLSRAEVPITEENIRLAERLQEADVPVTRESIEMAKTLEQHQTAIRKDTIEALERQEVAQAEQTVRRLELPPQKETVEAVRQIIRAEIPVTNETVEVAVALSKEAIPVTKENVEVAQTLQQENLPVTKENVQAAVELSKESVPVEKESLEVSKALQRAELPVTKETVEAVGTDNPDPERIETRVAEITVEKAEQPPTRENIEIAKTLIKEAVPVTKETMQIAETLTKEEVPVTKETVQRELHMTSSQPIAQPVEPIEGLTEEESVKLVEKVNELKLPEPPKQILEDAQAFLRQNNIEETIENVIEYISAKNTLNNLESTLSNSTINNMVTQGNTISTMNLGEIQTVAETLSKGVSVTPTRRQAPLTKANAEEIVNVARVMQEIKANENDIIKHAVQENIPLETKTLSQIEQLKEPPVVEETLYQDIKDEYNAELEKLSTKEQAKAETILKENNLGKTADNLQKVVQIMQMVEADATINSEAVKQIVYESMLMEELANEAVPEKLEKLIKDFTSGTGEAQKPIEQLLSTLKKEISAKNQAFEKTEAVKYVEKILQLQETAPTSLRWMEKNQIPMTLNNIQAMQSLMKNPFGMGNQLSKLKGKATEEGVEQGNVPAEDEIDELLDSVETTDLEGLKNEADPRKSLEELYRKLESVAGQTEKTEILEQVKLLQNSMRIKIKSNSLQIPIKINEKISDLHVYVLNDIDNKSEITSYMSLQTEKLGVTQVHIKQTGMTLSLALSSDSQTTAEQMQANQFELETQLNAAGFQLAQLTYGTESPRNLLQEETLGTAEMASATQPTNQDDFYAAVSEILKHIEELETRE